MLPEAETPAQSDFPSHLCPEGHAHLGTTCVPATEREAHLRKLCLLAAPVTVPPVVSLTITGSGKYQQACPCFVPRLAVGPWLVVTKSPGSQTLSRGWQRPSWHPQTPVLPTGSAPAPSSPKTQTEALAYPQGPTRWRPPSCSPGQLIRRLSLGLGLLGTVS